jgi:hypothetical protein
VVVLLAAHWESGSEEGWFTRQVAGALANVADVHVITPEGPVAHTVADSVFTLHRLGSPLDRAAELRRDLLIAAVAATGGDTRAPLGRELASLIDQDLLDPWDRASGVVDTLRPDRVVIVGHQNLGAVAAIGRCRSQVPVTLVALGSDVDSLAFTHFDQVFDRAEAILAVTESERLSIVEHHGRPEAVHRVGAPQAANPSVLTEPNTWVGDTGYTLVITGISKDDKVEENELSRLLRMRLTERPVGIVYTDAFDAWHQGRLNRGWAVERSSDLARLMAWAGVTIDLCPGTLFARRCVDSLLYGTPIIVPHDSRAREHAQRGAGGLWFAEPAELIWCAEAMSESSVHDTFAAQGRAYAESEYGSTDRFIDRVVESCGLASDTAPARITA